VAQKARRQQINAKPINKTQNWESGWVKKSRHVRVNNTRSIGVTQTLWIIYF